MERTELLDRVRRLGPIIFALALAAACTRLWLVLGDAGTVNSSDWGLRDFRDATYYPGKSIVAGDNPYASLEYIASHRVAQHFPAYSPLLPIGHLPLTALPYAVARLLFATITVGLTVALAKLTTRWSLGRTDSGTVLAVAGAILLTRPGLQNFVVGSSAALFALAATVILYRGRSAAPIVLASYVVATAKPTIALPLIVLMLCRTQRRAVLTGAGLAALVTAPIVLWIALRTGGLDQFATSISDNIRFETVAGAGGSDVFRVDILAALTRLTTLPSSLLMTTLTFVGLVIAAVPSLRRLDRYQERTEALHLSSLIMALVIVLSINHHPYDMLVLATPAVALWSGQVDGLLSQRRRVAMSLLLAATAWNFAATAPVIRRITEESLLWHIVANANVVMLSGVLALALKSAMSLSLAEDQASVPARKPVH